MLKPVQAKYSRHASVEITSHCALLTHVFEVKHEVVVSTILRGQNTLHTTWLLKLATVDIVLLSLGELCTQPLHHLLQLPILEPISFCEKDKTSHHLPV